MRVRLKWLAAVGLAASVGCVDGLSPPTEAVPPPPAPRLAEEMHMLRQSTVFPARQPGEFGALFEATGSPKELERYEASFWAVHGQEQSLKIAYADGLDFIELSVGANTLLAYPDGTPFGANDSVLITIAIDSSLLLVDFQPSGLTFDDQAPAVLNIRYGDAEPDLNGDGVVDDQDSQIESTQLGLWIQQGDSQPWYPNEANHFLETKRFVGYLYHFSNYTVSW
jgi:hypothetical protein